MEWSDEGIVLGTRRHGEANAILEVMTREHGRHLGLVRGGAGSRQRPILQPGNRVAVTWRARLDEHLGHYSVEGLELHAAGFLGSSAALYGIAHLGALCRLLPERDPHPGISEAVEAMVPILADARLAGAELVRFELQILAELGFGLDLASCAATGETKNLVYVSPRSGRAVSQAAGEAWHDRLLRLPHFIGEEQGDASVREIADGFAMTGYFLTRHDLEPRGLAMPDARLQFIAALTRQAADPG